MRMKCGSCSFHTIVASWHLHLKTVQPSFWEVSRLSAAFFWCLVWVMSFCHHYGNSNVVWDTVSLVLACRATIVLLTRDYTSLVVSHIIPSHIELQCRWSMMRWSCWKHTLTGHLKQSIFCFLESQEHSIPWLAMKKLSSRTPMIIANTPLISQASASHHVCMFQMSEVFFQVQGLSVYTIHMWDLKVWMF